MTRLFGTFALVLWAAVAGAQDHAALVVSVKTALLARGVDLSGPCGAFAITLRVAWALRSEGAGLLDKPAGNNCQGFATDIVAYAHGNIVDILSDGGNLNGPQWQCCDTVDPSRYRAPLDPGEVITPPVINPPPPPSVDLSAILAQLRALAENQAFLAENVKQTVRNEVAAERAADASEHQAIRDEVQSVWKNIGLGVLDLLKQPWVWTAIGGIFAGLKMKGL